MLFKKFLKKRNSRKSGSKTPENQSKTDLRAKELFDEIVRCVNQNRYARARELREQLIAQAPKAVSEIVRSGELIEQGRRGCMNPAKSSLWADLFNQFNENEASAFYFALKDFVVKANQPVFRQGECDNRLYFICSGTLKLKYYDYQFKKNVSFAILKPGDIAGVETFFTLTNHTMNCIAMEDSEISYLDKSAYQKILARHQSIESKLFQYCKSKQTDTNKGKIGKARRRADKRYKTDLMAYIQRFDAFGNLEGEGVEVKVSDISVGGLAYRANSRKIREATRFHNSRILITAFYRKNSSTYELKKTGRVVSLLYLPHDECSVHVKFEELMDETHLMEIAKYNDIMASVQ